MQVRVEQKEPIPDFLGGDGEMAARMRTHDWSASPLGAPSTWPQSLRTAVRLLLNTKHPMYIFWGAHSACLYNDAYRQSIGPERHPCSLGQPGEQVWSEIWDIIGPQIETVMSGKGATWHENHLVPITRNGRREDVYWTYSYCPIDDQTMPGGVGGVLVVCTETTEAVHARKRQAFLIALGDGLRPLSDPRAVMAAAAKMLGQHLSVDRAGYAEIDASGAFCSVESDWTAGEMPSLSGCHTLDDFGPRLIAELRSGRTVAFADVLEEPLTAGEETAAAYHAASTRAAITVPLIKGGRWVAAFYVHKREPRHWTKEDDELVRDVAERTWAAAEQARAEARLRESQARLGYALRAASAGIWDWDISSGAVTWSPENYALYGRDPVAPLSFEDWKACLHPDDREDARRAVQQAIEGSAPEFRIEFRIVRRDGAVRWLLALGRVERAHDGAALRMSGINLDITGQKRAEAARLVAEEGEWRKRQDLKAVLQAIPAAVVIAEDAACTRMTGNDFGHDLLRIPLGENISKSAPPGDAPRNFEVISDGRVLAPEELPIQLAAATRRAVHNAELELRFKDGDRRHLLGNALPLFDEGGEVRGAVGAFLDITERKHAEERLRQSEELFRGIYEHASTGIAITDWNGTLQSCNPAFCAMIGYSLQELSSLDFSELVHPEDREANTAEVRRLMAQDISSFETVNRYLAKDGRPIWVHKRGSLLRDGGGHATHMIALVTDITERKRQEEQIHLLLREVSHRSKNMLTLVQAVARQTVASTPANFLKRFDERILALSASQDLLVKSNWKGVELEELARSQLAHFNDWIGARIKVSGPRVLVSAAAAQALGMALHELSTNAGKYGALSNATGEVDVCWTLEEAAGGEETFTMSWRERGGPPVSAPSRTGFGSTVICRLAEGSLNAKVELSYAASGVVWRLQCRAGELSEKKATQASAAYTGGPRKKAHSNRRPRVLVVEDEAVTAFQIEQTLIEAGFDVVGPAPSVAGAVKYLKHEDCDAAVLDITLGSETSEPVARMLNELGTPFVTLSAYVQHHQPVIFLGAAWLTKPLHSELLIAKLRHCLKS